MTTDPDPGRFAPPAFFSDNHDWPEQTLRQLEKDFQLQGFRLRLPEKCPEYPQLLDLLEGFMKEENLLHSNRLSGLLYQIDVSEKTARQRIESTGPEVMHRALAHEIVKRSFQKIYWRNSMKPRP